MAGLKDSMTGDGTTMKAVTEEVLGEEVIAVTPERVVALKGTPISDEDGRDTGTVVKGEIASWPRGEVSATPASAGEDSKGGTLEIPGASIPVFDRSIGDPRERELFAALAG
jgi:hypothetical protein